MALARVYGWVLNEFVSADPGTGAGLMKCTKEWSGSGQL